MDNRRLRILALASLLAVTPAGFYTKFYHGPGYYWVNNSLGGILYEIFWCLLVFFLLPRVKPFTIAAAVFIVTCVLECLQLWHPHFLGVVRANFMGSTLLGTTFVWSDFVYYIIGSFFGWIWMRLIANL